MKLTLIRHIKTSAPEGVCYGQTDVTLPEGFEITHAQLAEQLKDESFDVIIASPLQRCSLLAKTIADGRPVIYDDRLMELNFGDWENKMWKDIETLPEAAAFFDDYIHVAPPNGESFKAMTNRISNFLTELKTNHPQQSVLIVAHGGPIRVLQGLAESLPLEDYFKREVPYGNISQLYY
jgi:alpha-ribazole phosphatase